MTRHHTIFNLDQGQQVDVPFTRPEELARDKEEAEALEDYELRLIVRETRAKARKNAVGKLVKLGLTEGEVDALVSIIAA